VDQVRERFSREYLVALMSEFKGNVTKAAERAHVERETLHRLLKKHGIRGHNFREDDSS
jgi:DNA-binding NtrC family response regulator